MPSITVRFWSGVPPRTASRLPKSSVDATPARVSRVRKTLSMLPGARNTASGVTGVADGRSCTAISGHDLDRLGERLGEQPHLKGGAPGRPVDLDHRFEVAVGAELQTGRFAVEGDLEAPVRVGLGRASAAGDLRPGDRRLGHPVEHDTGHRRRRLRRRRRGQQGQQQAQGPGKSRSVSSHVFRRQ